LKLPKVQRTEMHFLDAEQVEDLAEAIDCRYATLIRFAAYSGLRPSELTALRVGRLDLLRGTARVVEAAPEVDGRLHWGGVKTHEARTVRLPRSIAEELAADLAGRPRDPEALVFTAPLGGPLRPHTLEQARAAALADRERTQRGPAVVTLGERAGR
jgi:integrase